MSLIGTTPDIRQALHAAIAKGDF